MWKQWYIMVLVVSFGHSENITLECEKAIKFATSIHWRYVNNKVSLREDKNAEKRANSICNAQQMSRRDNKRS